MSYRTEAICLDVDCTEKLIQQVHEVWIGADGVRYEEQADALATYRNMLDGVEWSTVEWYEVTRIDSPCAEFVPLRFR